MAEELSTTEHPPVQADAPAPDSASPGKAEAPASQPPADQAEGAGNEPKSSFEALSKRLAEIRSEKPVEAKPEAKAEEKPKDDAEDDTPGETAEEKQAFKGKDAETKIRTLSTERRNLRKEVATLKEQAAQIEPLRQRAQQFDEFAGWVRTTGLTQDEVTQGLQISALMKADPFKALEMVTPIYQELQRRAGAVLPDDLATAVDSGEVTESHAQELARLRRQTQHLSERTEQVQRHSQEQAQQAETQRVQMEVKNAVNAAEAEIMRGDVDYPKKKAWITEQVKSLWVDEGIPTNAQAAVEQYRKAVNMVNERVKLMTPRQRSSTPITETGASTNVAKPANSLEAMRLQLERAGRRVIG